MQEVPEWIIQVIETQDMTCRNNCNTKFGINNLMSIGIQESGADPRKDVLCIGMFCVKCKEIIIFELKEMSLINFAFDILDQETSDKMYKKENTKETSSRGRQKRRKVKKTVKKRIRN